MTEGPLYVHDLTINIVHMRILAFKPYLRRMADTFGADRKAWELAKQQLAPSAPPSNIALLAQEIKTELQSNSHLTIEEVMRRISFK